MKVCKPGELAQSNSWRLVSLGLDCYLLRTRRERPSGCCAADKRDELAPFRGLPQLQRSRLSIAGVRRFTGVRRRAPTLELAEARFLKNWEKCQRCALARASPRDFARALDSQSGLFSGGFKTNGLWQSGMVGRQSKPGIIGKATGPCWKYHEHVTLFIPSLGSLKKMAPFIVVDKLP
jgi:hypothetical protein